MNLLGTPPYAHWTHVGTGKMSNNHTNQYLTMSQLISAAMQSIDGRQRRGL